MKVTVKIAGQIFEVEVGDVNARPVLATIGGEQFEVWVETEAETFNAPTLPAPVPTPQAAHTNSHLVLAPLPGVIISIAVQPGARVAPGQELCVIEAMKMKNAIRANRAGTVATVHITAGQQIKHHAVILEYTP